MKHKFNISGMERRTFALPEVRVQGADGEPVHIVWYPAVYNSLSDDLGGFRERIRPGAFTKTLGEADIRALYNHNPDWVLGRNKSGTLQLKDEERGLNADVTPPEATWANDLVVSVRRGDVDQGSFSFQTLRDEWKEENNGIVRELIEVKLFDVSLVTFPAYPQTSAHIRTILQEAGIDFLQLVQAITRSREGALSADDRSLVSATIQTLQGLLAGAPGQESHPPETDAERAQARLKQMRRRLELAEHS